MYKMVKIAGSQYILKYMKQSRLPTTLIFYLDKK